MELSPSNRKTGENVRVVVVAAASRRLDYDAFSDLDELQAIVILCAKDKTHPFVRAYRRTEMAGLQRV